MSATEPNSPACKTCALVPIKRFGDAKERLSEDLSSGEREDLARTMAQGVVLAAASSCATFVVCDDDQTQAWAADLAAAASGANVLATIRVTSEGLNPALTEAVARLEAGEFAEQLGSGAAAPGLGARVMIAHADLPLASARSFEAVLAPEPPVAFDEVVIVADRHEDGTNVMALPLGRGFAFHYGPGSLAAHVAEAQRLGLGVTIKSVPELRLDIDTPEDLALARAAH